MLFLLAADDDRALGAVKYVVADARRREGALQLAESPRAEYDQAGLLLPGYRYDHLARLTALRPYLAWQLRSITNTTILNYLVYLFTSYLLLLCALQTDARG